MLIEFDFAVVRGEVVGPPKREIFVRSDAIVVGPIVSVSEEQLKPCSNGLLQLHTKAEEEGDGDGMIFCAFSFCCASSLLSSSPQVNRMLTTDQNE